MVNFSFIGRVTCLRASLLAWLGMALAASGFEPGFWVWKSDLVLTNRQQEELCQAGVRELYWYVGALQPRAADGSRRSVSFGPPRD